MNQYTTLPVGRGRTTIDIGTVHAAPWCSGLTCHPVKVEIGGSNPLGVARPLHCS
jgi:hypothetical protein